MIIMKAVDINTGIMIINKPGKLDLISLNAIREASLLQRMESKPDYLKKKLDFQNGRIIEKDIKEGNVLSRAELEREKQWIED